MASGTRAQAVVLDTDYTSFHARGLYVGVSGDVNCDIGGVTVLLKNMPAGLHPLQVTQVRTVSTTATNMVLIG